MLENIEAAFKSLPDQTLILKDYPTFETIGKLFPSFVEDMVKVGGHSALSKKAFEGHVRLHFIKHMVENIVERGETSAFEGVRFIADKLKAGDKVSLHLKKADLVVDTIVL